MSSDFFKDEQDYESDTSLKKMSDNDSKIESFKAYKEE